jgi:uncharacterized protein DUF6894
MPQFFFHFRDANGFEPDEEGLEMPDLDVAYLEAFEAAKEMWGEAIRTMRNPTRQQFEISDADGKTLLVVPLQEVMDSLKGVPKPPPMETAERAARLSTEVREAVSRAYAQLSESRALLARLLV